MKLHRYNPLHSLKAARFILAGSGVIAVAIAATILFAPESFYASYGIRLAGNASLTNELKAPAGLLLLAGVVMLLGAVRRQFAIQSLATAAAVYLCYGFARVLSIGLDGVPHDSLISAAGIELLIGGVCLLTLVQLRQNPEFSN